MVQRFFRNPFATTGDKTAIPDAAQPDGSISYAQGFGPDYERVPGVDPLAKRVPRNQTNQYLFDITDNLGYWQRNAYPEYVTAAQNGGIALAYPISARVRYTGLVYASLVNNNTALPTDATKWAIDNPAPLAFATDAETQAGVVNNKAITPANLTSRTATASRTGILALATTTEAAALTDASKAITPATLAAVTAHYTGPGIIRVATNDEVQAGVVNNAAVVPQSLATLTATQTRAGLVELATGPEVAAGTDATRAVSPLTLLSRIASTAQLGLTRLATNAEVITGTDATIAVTPASLQALTATTGRDGLVQLSTNAQAQAGTDATTAVTPQALASVTATVNRAGLVPLATATEVLALSDNTKAITPAALSQLTATNSRPGIWPRATNIDIRTGTEDNKVITPFALRAAFDVGAVGTYAWLMHPTVQVQAGDIYPGNALRYSGVSQSSGAADMSTASGIPPGTQWVAVGSSVGAGNTKFGTLWYRLA